MILRVAVLSLCSLVAIAGSLRGAPGRWLGPGQKPAYWDDLLRKPSPEYPYEARRQRVTGRGVFRVRIDYKTGKATDVIIIKSTGAKILDQAATEALATWSVKPRTWREIEVPITFAMAGARPQIENLPWSTTHSGGGRGRYP